MATITAQLRLNENGADRVDNIVSDQPLNNTSRPLAWGNTARNAGFDAITIGGDYKIGDPGYLLGPDGYDGYRFNFVTDADGETEDIKIVFEGENIDSVTVYGDTEAGQFPTLITLDEGEDGEKTITSDDAVLSVIFDEPADHHSLTFKRWNRPFYNPAITAIEIFPHFVSFDKYWIASLTTESASTNDPSALFYGAIPNDGNIELVDYNGELSDYSENGFLNKDVFGVDVYYNGKMLQSHTALDSPYFDANGGFELSLTNALAKWQDAKYNGRVVLNGTTITAYALLSDMLINSEGSAYTQQDVDRMLETVINVGYGEYTVKEYLTGIIIPPVTVTSSTLYNAVRKVCTLAQLQVLADDDGGVRFVNARPLATQEEKDNVIVIPRRNQFSSFDYNILLTNAYTNVSISGV